VSSASRKQPTVHAAVPQEGPLVPVCWHYHRGRLSYDGMMLALLEKRVVRGGYFNCPGCWGQMRAKPGLFNAWKTGELAVKQATCEAVEESC
jgi:hypothetical protein